LGHLPSQSSNEIMELNTSSLPWESCDSFRRLTAFSKSSK